MQLLIIKPSSLGDIVHGLLIATSIKAQRPETRIDWVVRDIFAPLVERSGLVDRVLLFHRGAGAGAFLRLLGRIRERQYDAVLDLQGLLRSGLMTCAARSARKIGRADAREGAGLFYTERVPLPPSGHDSHAVDILAAFLPALGLAPSMDGRLNFSKTPVIEIDSRLSAPYFLLFPHSRGRGKEWPGFADLSAVILRRWPDHAVVVASDRKLDLSIADGHDRLIDLTGRTSIDDMIALILEASAVIANDSGPMHLAAAAGRPLIVLFGPTAPGRFGPYPAGMPMRRVIAAPGGDLLGLDMATVLDALADLMASSRLK